MKSKSVIPLVIERSTNDYYYEIGFKHVYDHTAQARCSLRKPAKKDIILTYQHALSMVLRKQI